MYLSKWEENALQGEFGEVIQLAMNVIVKVCKALKARKLVEITHAHISGVSYFNIGDEGLELLEDLVKKGARVSVYSTANPSSIAIVDEFVHKYDRDVVVKQEKIIRLLTVMGIDEKSFTCVPYKLRMPKYGEHLAWAESSAVIYANSVIGARTNREGGVIALMAAIAGRTCYCGMHIDEERHPTEMIKIEFPIDSIALASMLGLYIGKLTRGVPYVEAVIKVADFVKDIALRSMLSSIASTSSSPLALIEKISPDARNIDKSSLERITIDTRELKNFIEEKCSNILLLGCPHIDGEEVEKILFEIATKIKSYGIRRVFIALPRFEIRKLHLIVNRFNDVEIVYLPGACPVVSNLKAVGISSLCTPHGKAYYYLPKLSGASACLTNIV